MPLQIPHPNTPLRLYRHMLREATYLPLLCRPWITSRIQDRFRDCSHTDNPNFYIKEAHHYLRYLRSANAGHLRRMLRLCLHATGRVGKRRRILGRTELHAEPPSNSGKLEEVAKLANSKPQNPDWIENWHIDKVRAIAFSQSSQQGSNWPHAMRKKVDPRRVIPTENCFGLPLSKKLHRNKLKRHWANVLKRLLPPLPRGEWDQLGALARGEADPQHYQSPTRRPVAKPIRVPRSSTSSETRTTSWEDFVTKPVRRLERGNSRAMKSLTSEEDQDPRGHGRPIGLRVLAQRKIRRGIYDLIWKMTPLVNKNPRSGNWSVTWGGREPQLVGRPRKKDMQFFEGITETERPKRLTRRQHR
ncbi:hypothetical protein GGR52DRAFT_374734 [Hypoxylon sp. FL1284]|nr:hypothetical protein GGR52DRAFT_374734 [Hypoxylon sp. FL1284]